MDFLMRNWKWLLGILVGLVGIVLAVAFFTAGREDKTLRGVVLSQTTLVGGPIPEVISITYKDRGVRSLSLVAVRLENTGTEPVRPEDYADPIVFVFDEGSEIIQATATESQPPEIVEIGVKVTLRGKHQAEVEAILLNEGDRVIVEFLVIDLPSSTDVEAFDLKFRIADVEEIPVVSAIEEEASVPLFLNSPELVALFFLFSTVLIGVSLRSLVSIKRTVAPADDDDTFLDESEEQ